MVNCTLAFTAIQRWSSLRPQCNLYFNEASSIPTVTIGTAVNNLYCIPQLQLTFPSAAGFDSTTALGPGSSLVSSQGGSSAAYDTVSTQHQHLLLDSVVLGFHIAYCSPSLYSHKYIAPSQHPVMECHVPASNTFSVGVVQIP